MKPSFRIYLNELTIVITSAKTKQAACRMAFCYWINEGLLKKQPATNHDFDSSFKDVYVEVDNG